MEASISEISKPFLTFVLFPLLLISACPTYPTDLTTSSQPRRPDNKIRPSVDVRRDQRDRKRRVEHQGDALRTQIGGMRVKEFCICGPPPHIDSQYIGQWRFK